MKHIKIILGLVLFASVTTFAQSPRIKLNQITKDTVKGSVLISSPTDSGMVYSRDFYIAYGVDTLLILYGDTIGGVGGGFASVLSDGVTITGDGTTGNELKVDTATVISTIKGLVDTLTNRGYLTSNQTITLSGDVTGSGTTAITATVVDDSHNHIISNVDFLQDSLDAKANDSDLANYVTIAGAETITGAKTFTNTFTQSGGDANFDSGTLYVDESENRVGIGTSIPNNTFEVVGTSYPVGKFVRTTTFSGIASGYNLLTRTTNDMVDGFGGGIVLSVEDNTSGELPMGRIAAYRQDADNSGNLRIETWDAGSERVVATFTHGGNVGIGTPIPTETLDVNGNARFRSIGSGASAGALHYTSTGVLTTNTSDVRLKTNLQPLENTLNKLLSINTYTFNWIDETDRVDLGMVAQEVEQIFPNLVFTNNVDGYKGIHYDKFTSILTKAIQEQQAIIETQASEINQLKTLITDLTNRIIILENK